jgi:hypothetical protein
MYQCRCFLLVFSFKDVPQCGLCKSDDLELTARIAGKKNFPYVDIKCKSCRASVTFGKTQDNPDVYFLRKVDTNQTGKNGKPVKALDWRAFGNEHEDQISE